MRLALKNETLRTHGAGAYYGLCLLVGRRRFIRFSVGGYGNIPGPIGCWCWFPRVKRWQNGPTNVHFLNAGVTWGKWY